VSIYYVSINSTIKSSKETVVPEFLTSPIDNPDYSLSQREIDAIVYLNTYGMESLIKWLKNNYQPDWYYYIDFTNDNIPDLGIHIPFYVGSYLYILGCQNGEFKILYRQPGWEFGVDTYSVVYIQDGNKNEIPEITFWAGAASQGMHIYEMIEWKDTAFRSIIQTSPDEYKQRSEIENYARVDATGYVYYQDIDNDNSDEFIINTGFPVADGYEIGLPFQNVLRFHKWNGEYYAFYRQYYGPPEYRFQAIQNGDRLSLSKEYDYAIESYNQVIEDDTLQWWTEERHAYLQEIFHQSINNTSLPSPEPLIEDPNEHPNIISYALYRIMLIYIQKADIQAAQLTLEKLQKQYHESGMGYSYLELATIFWEEYQKTRDISMACNTAIEFTMSHPKEILAYLGNGKYAIAYFGYQSIVYEPETICPF